MKKLFLISILLFSTVALARNVHELGDVPFPWGTAIPFPWENIEGIWQAKFGKYVDYFSFRLVSQPGWQEPEVQVLEVESNLHTVLATGNGFASSNGKLVQALMNSKRGCYVLIVRAYQRQEGNAQSTYTVVTIRNAYGPGPGVHSLMRKMSG